jgi:hypothetical protein
MNSLARYILDLGFNFGEPTAPPLQTNTTGESSLYLGRRRTSLMWDFYSWFALALGIFLRSGIQLPNLIWKVDALTWKSFLAALVVAFATFGPFMRWVNRRKTQPGLQQFTAPFTFGFILSLSEFGAKHLISHLIT